MTEPAAAAALESPAFPRLLRILAVVLVVDVVAFGLWSVPALRRVEWPTGGLAVLLLAVVCVIWVGYWIVYGRTRLDGDVLSQTWLWNKRVDAADAARLKLVHWRLLERVVAPRLLVRRRNGGITWFHSADARLLTGFAERVAMRAAERAAA